MTLNDLTVNFRTLKREDVLSAWVWLIGAHRLPVLVTAAGDAFVQDAATGEVFFLDTAGPELVDIASSVAEFEKLLRDAEFVTEFFDPVKIQHLQKKGLKLGPLQVYSYKKALVLGGKNELSNIEVSDLSVHFSLLGQIQEKVSKLPEGTPVGNINLSGAG